MRRYSPEVAIKSLCVPFFSGIKLGQLTYRIRNPHNLGGRVFMIEIAAMLEVVLLLIEFNDLHLVLCVLDK